MKPIRYTSVFLFLALSFIACKKSFLEVKDNSNLNRQSYVKDSKSIEEFLNGIFVVLSTSYETYYAAAYPELIADNLKPFSEGKPLALHYNWSQIVDNNSTPGITFSMNSVWLEYYRIIRACNFVIEEIGKYQNENQQKASLIKGKAYAARALVYFKLVNIFAQSYSYTSDASHTGVPYITDSDIKTPYQRQTVAEVYDGIVADLTASIALLPSTISDTRVINGAAAKALLARVYLFKKDYVNAKKLSAEITNQFPLMSINEGYPNDIFKNKAPGQTEVLFQLTPIRDNAGNSSSFLGYTVGNGRLFSYVATNDIATILKESPNDIRSSWIKDTLTNLLNVKKFPDAVAGLTSLRGADYYASVIRSSEMFLTAAEASAKTGDDNSAQKYLNAIRKRANPTIADVTVMGQPLLDSIYKERRKELCFEGLRMFDLQRWKKPVQRTDVLPGYQTNLPYPSDKAIAPIPGQDVKLMGLQQNSGYQ